MKLPVREAADQGICNGWKGLSRDNLPYFAAVSRQPCASGLVRSVTRFPLAPDARCVNSFASLAMRARFSPWARWLPALFWMALIFTGSSDSRSAAHSSRLLAPFLRWLFHGTLPAARIEEIHHLFRKAGHLTEYAVLGMLFWWALPPSERLGLPSRRWRRATLALFLAAGYAATDEFHQCFVPTREANFGDVLIDTLGATLGLGLLLTVQTMHGALKRRWNQAGAGSAPSLPG